MEFEKSGIDLFDTLGSDPSVYLSGSFGEPSLYNPVYHLLRTSAPHQTIRIYFNSQGGRIDTAFQLTQAIRESDATVIGHLDHTAYSAAGMVFLACHGWQLSRYSIFMAHPYSGTVFGGRTEMKQQHDFQHPWFEEVLEDYYVPFFSKKEFEKVMAGGETYLEYQEISQRLDKVVSHRANLAKKLQKEL